MVAQVARADARAAPARYAPTDMTRYAMPRANPFIKVLLTLTGASHGSVDLDESSLTVRLGFGFSASVPRSSITAAVHDPHREFSIGAHGWRGHWLVNTTTDNIVKVTVVPTAKGRCLGVPVDVRELRISLEDPAAFLSALGYSTSA